jgi:hypothetical protein
MAEPMLTPKQLADHEYYMKNREKKKAAAVARYRAKQRPPPERPVGRPGQSLEIKITKAIEKWLPEINGYITALEARVINNIQVITTEYWIKLARDVRGELENVRNNLANRPPEVTQQLLSAAVGMWRAIRRTIGNHLQT